jgi:purine-binding chemotaxis protein CheW
MQGPSVDVVAPRGGELQLLLCQAGAIVCALPLEHVLETLRPLPIESVAGMPAFMLGLSVIRGTPVPVVSLAGLLGAQGLGDATRFVVARVNQRRIALSVARVLGVRSIRVDGVAELPPLLREARADFIAAVGALDAQLLVVLESARLVPESAWTLLRAGSESA